MGLMGQPAEKRRRATYADVEAAPPNRVAELIQGTLHLFPRSAPRHARASSAIGGELFGPFDRGRGGPGGWWILDEPELHFPDPSEAGAIDVVVPDVAGWRRERLPELPETAHFAIAPDWICEVLSSSTADVDRGEKMPIYARAGVRHAWLVDPVARTIEVYTLDRGGRWSDPVIHRGAAPIAIPPFEAVPLDLAALWST